MRRTALALLLPALLLTACSSTITGTATPAPTTAAPTSSAPGDDDTSDADLDEARGLVEDLYADFSASSEGGLASLAEFVSEHNHPDFSYPADQCLAFLQSFGQTDAYRVTLTPDVEELEPDEGWEVPSGVHAGDQPDGDVYTVPVTIRETDVDVDNTDDFDAHVAVLDGEAYFFQSCED